MYTLWAESKPVSDTHNHTHTHTHTHTQGMHACIHAYVLTYTIKTLVTQVKEIRDWMSLNRTHLKQGSSAAQRVLVLRGPSGTGKSTLVRVLAAEARMPLIDYRSGPGVTFVENKWCEMPWVSEVQELVAFLHSTQIFGGCTLVPDLQASSGSGRTALVLLEDVPHIHSADQRNALVAAVRQICLASRSLCIIVHSDSQHDSFSSLDWPGCLLGLPALSLIKINSVAVTFVKKALNRVLGLAKLHIDSDTVTAIANSADGDLRNAVNALQMWCAGQRLSSSSASKKCKGKGKEKKSGRAGGDGGASVGGTSCYGRDAGLTLFHSLGKILHNKRLPRPLPSFPQSIHDNDGEGAASGGSPRCNGVGEQRVRERDRHTHTAADLRGPLSFVPEEVVAAGTLC